jgi:hypothetical protein
MGTPWRRGKNGKRLKRRGKRRYVVVCPVCKKRRSRSAPISKGHLRCRDCFQEERPSNRGKRYWTKALELQYQQEMAQREEAARLENNKYLKNWRARRKAEGRPVKGGPDKPGSSAPRFRRWYQRQKEAKAAAIIAAEEVIREAKRAVVNAKSARYRARKIARREEAIAVAANRIKSFKTDYWFSPAITETEAKKIIESQHPDWTETQLNTEFASLEACTRHEKLSLNKFVIISGLGQAIRQRAIFFELQRQSNRLDYAGLVEDAGKISSLRDLPQFQLENEGRVLNAIQKSHFYAQQLWGNGAAILAVLLAP